MARGQLEENLPQYNGEGVDNVILKGTRHRRYPANSNPCTKGFQSPHRQRKPRDNRQVHLSIAARQGSPPSRGATLITLPEHEFSACWGWGTRKGKLTKTALLEVFRAAVSTKTSRSSSDGGFLGYRSGKSDGVGVVSGLRMLREVLV